MEIVSNKEEMVFRKDYNGKPIYSIGLSKKNKNGGYDNGYITTNFKEGTDIKNKSKIKIKNGWLSFYLKDNKTIPTIFVSEYELVGEPNPYEEFGKSIKTESDIGEQIEIQPEDLPF